MHLVNLLSQKDPPVAHKSKQKLEQVFNERLLNQ